jgi:hypothetical protein
MGAFKTQALLLRCRFSALREAGLHRYLPEQIRSVMGPWVQNITPTSRFLHTTHAATLSADATKR